MPNQQTDIADTTQQGALVVQGIDFCIDTNGESHYTSKFNLMSRSEDKCLVVRRGQSFKLDLLLNRPYDVTKDAISFTFTVSDVRSTRVSSSESVHSSKTVPLLEKATESLGVWSATFESQKANHLMVAVTPAADCIVAAWNVEVDTKLSSGNSFSYTHSSPIYVLFNPWCKNDTVYMPDQSHRDEYVLEDEGLLYTGWYYSIEPLRWYYKQYEKDILDCALYLVGTVGKVEGHARSDAVVTVRALSAALNAEDDSGVIVGKWKEDRNEYSDGSLPQTWKNSMDILQKYYEKKQPVRYGQCWVFAAVLTTICRALGVPCRPVTGFNAGSDTDGSFTIDILVDEAGNELEDLTKDKDWNFHVWNEVWMERPHLGPEYTGWQVLDSTPQAISEGINRCGPASLRAIRDGELTKPYDVPFVFAQVNADKVYWQYLGKDQPIKLFGSDFTTVGRKFLTKAVGIYKEEDLTDTYKKYPERSRDERIAIEKALKKSNSKYARDYLKGACSDITFNFEFGDDIKIGQDFSVVVHMKNISVSESHNVTGMLQVDTTYPGTPDNDKPVKWLPFNKNIAPEATELVNMIVTFDDYYMKLLDQKSKINKHAFFRIRCLGKIVDKQFDLFAYDVFRVRNPDIKISIDDNPVSHQQCNVSLKVENTLPIPLTRGKFFVTGPGIERMRTIHLHENVAPGEFATAQFKLIPPTAGNQHIITLFTSKEMRSAYSFLSFTVA